MVLKLFCHLLCLQTASLPGLVYQLQAMQYWATGAGAVARADDEGSGPNQGHSAPPHLCTALCQCGCTSSSVLSCAGEVYARKHIHCTISSISRNSSDVSNLCRYVYFGSGFICTNFSPHWTQKSSICHCSRCNCSSSSNKRALMSSARGSRLAGHLTNNQVVSYKQDLL